MLKKKILLINTIPASLIRADKKTNFPLELLSIATWIKKRNNFEVCFIDCVVEKDYKELIKREIKNTFVVGLSVMSLCIPNALKKTRMIKKLNPKIKIVLGGVHCRLYPQQTIKHKSIDFVVKNYSWKVPKNLERWKAYFKENGGYKTEEYPWINNPNYYAGLQFYVKNGKSSFLIFLKRLTLPYKLKFKLALLVLYAFAKIRMLFNYPFKYLIGKNKNT